jgi:hypothetical protein
MTTRKVTTQPLVNEVAGAVVGATTPAVSDPSEELEVMRDI